jgi:hypothetical protein
MFQPGGVCFECVLEIDLCLFSDEEVVSPFPRDLVNRLE